MRKSRKVITPAACSLSDFARRFGISRDLARDLVQRGELEALRLGERRVLITRNAEERWLASLPRLGKAA